MIGVRLEGGLGNQFFQYSAARALALRHGTEVLLDTSAYLQRSARYTFRPFELLRWHVRARPATQVESRSLSRARRFPWASGLITNWTAFVERRRGYDDAFARLSDGTYLIGYWQSPLYFSDHAQTLTTELQPFEALSKRSNDICKQIGETNSIAVHVRRGDYVTLPSAAAYHGALGLSYYREAIEYIRVGTSQPFFYVFSDEPEWCRVHLSLGKTESYFVGHNKDNDAWQDLILMSRCRHHIIANSSFSWWAAWLADQRYGVRERKVIAPTRWFAGRNDGDIDRFPAHWTLL